MCAEIKPNFDTERQKLADIIPLPAPFTVYIEQTRYCNFKCFYCIHSTRDDKNGPFQKLNYEIKHMNEDDFNKIVNDLKEFPQGSIKRIVFSGLGEPLANPNLPKYVKKITESNIAKRVEIITNGLLLNQNNINELVENGITNINISIQGLNAQTYSEVCSAKIDFNKFLNTLEYLYNNKKQAKIYIKIVDAALKNKDEEKQFYDTFSKYADRIYIEHLVQMQQSLESIKDMVDGKSFYGEDVIADRKICSPTFYFMQIGCDLDIFPCPVPGLSKPFSMGSAKTQSLLDIWNGKKRLNFLKALLKFQKDKFPDCKGCTNYNCILDPKEYLDKDAEMILKKLESKYEVRN